MPTNIAILSIIRQPRRWVATVALLVPAMAAAQWRITSPPAAAAWFGVLDSLGLAGTGAFAFTASTQPGRTALGRSLERGGRYEILHFVPLYYPSAGRVALADALTDAAGSAQPSAARAQFLVGTLRQTLPAAADRAVLRDLADMTRRFNLKAAAPASLAAWQAHWDQYLAAPLAPFLRDLRLDAGQIWVLPPLGPEGRFFGGVAADRTDNIVAVADAPGRGNGPLYAAVRELCFPLVSQTADARPEFLRASGSQAEAARRTGLAAVRCGAELLDRVAPEEAGPYRAHWLRVASGATSFDAAFPPDAVLSPGIHSALERYGARP